MQEHEMLLSLIAEQRNSGLVAAAGLSPLLRALDAYVRVTQARIAALEKANRHT